MAKSRLVLWAILTGMLFAVTPKLKHTPVVTVPTADAVSSYRLRRSLLQTPEHGKITSCSLGNSDWNAFCSYSQTQKYASCGGPHCRRRSMAKSRLVLWAILTGMLFAVTPRLKNTPVVAVPTADAVSSYLLRRFCRLQRVSRDFPGQIPARSIVVRSTQILIASWTLDHGRYWQ